jgi:hypothetical protein
MGEWSSPSMGTASHALARRRRESEVVRIGRGGPALSNLGGAARGGRRRGLELTARSKVGPLASDQQEAQLMRTLTFPAVIVCVVAMGTFAFAQSQAPAPPSTAPLETPQCQRGALLSPGETTGSGTLSDQLSRSKGIICPPAGVDPGIAVPPVGGGRTPVIPPPGTPDGDSSIVPK